MVSELAETTTPLPRSSDLNPYFWVRSFWTGSEISLRFSRRSVGVSSFPTPNSEDVYHRRRTPTVQPCLRVFGRTRAEGWGEPGEVRVDP